MAQLTWTVTNEFSKYIFMQVVTTQLLEARECWGTIQAVAIRSGTNCLLGLDLVNCWVFISFSDLFFTESESENRKAIR